MTNDFVLSPISLDEFEHLVERCIKRSIASNPTIAENNQFITMVEAGKLLSVSRVTIYQYINDGRLIKYKIGRTSRLLKADVLSLATPA